MEKSPQRLWLQHRFGCYPLPRRAMVKPKGPFAPSYSCYVLLLTQQQDTWEEVLPLLQFALNNAYCEATSSTPFRILLRRNSCSPLDFAASSETDSPNEDGCEPDMRLKQKLDEVNRFIQERQEEVMARMKNQVDRYYCNYTFEPGDQVLLSTKSLPYPSWEPQATRLTSGILRG